ncbi:MAG TPA: hypothetical protein VHD91_12605 [Gaiellaceae bacterium]|nr:hypothetical protein [Gaiellaceae bacterium]
MRPVSLPCAWEGCTERAHYEVRTKSEDIELRRKPWYCVRHSQPEEVLIGAHNARETTLVCVEGPYGRFWSPDGVTARTGFVHGPGFRAWASDFEPGTRLVVSARIESAAVGPQPGEAAKP